MQTTTVGLARDRSAISASALPADVPADAPSTLIGGIR